jgi:hypothetical protein
LEFLARSIRQEQEIKGIQIGKEDVKLSLLADNMLLHLKEPKNFVNCFGKAAGYKINIQNLVAFVYGNIDLRKQGNNPIYYSLKSNRVTLNKFKEVQQRPFQ